MHEKIGRFLTVRSVHTQKLVLLSKAIFYHFTNFPFLFCALFYFTDYSTPPDLGIAEQAGLRPLPQNKLALGLGPFAHHNPNSIACSNQESFVIETHSLCLIVRPFAGNYELYYTTTVSYTTDHGLGYRKIGWPLAITKT